MRLAYELLLRFYPQDSALHEARNGVGHSVASCALHMGYSCGFFPSSSGFAELLCRTAVSDLIKATALSRFVHAQRWIPTLVDESHAESGRSKNVVPAPAIIPSAIGSTARRKSALQNSSDGEIAWVLTMMNCDH